MNKNNIEVMAISELNRFMNRNSKVLMYTNSGDKEPHWDGNIYLFKNNKQSKEDFLGRVPVQVKGHISSDLSRNSVKFDVDLNDLKAFLKDGGAMFFIVYMKKDYSDSSIYYRSFSPIDINVILKETKISQKRKRFSFKLFPNDTNKIFSTLYNFYEHAKRQHSFGENVLKPIDYYLNKDDFQSVRIFDHSNDTKNISDTFIGKNNYAYVKVLDSDHLIPTSTLIKGISLSSDYKSRVMVNEAIHYNTINIEETEKKFVILFGKSTSITIFKDGKKQLEFHPTSKLDDLIKDYNFQIDFLTNKSLFIDDVLIVNPSDLDTLNITNLEEIQELLNYYIELKNLLINISVTKVLDFDNFEESDYFRLSLLIDSLSKKNKVKNSKFISNRLQTFKIGNINLVFYIQKKDEEGNVLIRDYFEEESQLLIKDENEELIEVSKYYTFSDENFSLIDNIIIGKIFNNIKSFGMNDIYYEVSNRILLNLIKAFDICSDISRKKEIYNCILLLSKWILDNESKKTLDTLTIDTLNYLQVVKRGRNLNKKEIRQLYAINHNLHADIFHKIGANLLIGDKEQYEIELDSLTIEKRNLFESFPIFKFFES